jgi:hypothetical protein
LQTAYLTVFELVNDGARPVPASDFESPIEIVSKNKAEIVRTIITNANPSDLAPIILLEDGSVKIKPMLLNPGDSVTLAVLSTKEEPMFSSRARIAGVRTVSILDAPKKAASPVYIAISLVAGLISFVAVNLVLGAWPSDGVTLRPRASFVVFMVAVFGATILLVAGLGMVGIEGFWPLLGVYVGCMLLTSVIARWLNSPITEDIVAKRDAT